MEAFKMTHKKQSTQQLFLRVKLHKVLQAKERT